MLELLINMIQCIQERMQSFMNNFLKLFIKDIKRRYNYLFV